MAHFISLFSGAGGLDLGLELAGWQCDYASDVDESAIETLELNKGRRLSKVRVMADTLIERSDIRETSGRQILSAIGKQRGEIALLAGGPPCQSWSSAGHQRGLSDPRGRLFEDYIRVATQLDVRWLVFENVRGLLTARGEDGLPGSALQLIRKELLRAGWKTEVNLLNAADFGVPQRRVRLFLLGYRVGDAPAFPSPTHAEQEWITLGGAIARLRRPTVDEIHRPAGKLARELASLQPGSGVKSPGKSETTRPGGHWGYKQGAFIADMEKPARTVTANAQQDWIRDEALGLRRLTPRECAAIQTFPASWKFAGGRATQYRLIGNAVPPKLARQIGSALLESAKGKSKNKTEVSADVLALPRRLQAAVDYTRRDDARNGESRRLAPSRRRVAAAG